MIQLIPAQETAYRVLKYASNAGSLMLLSRPSGRGRTTVLRIRQPCPRAVCDDATSSCHYYPRGQYVETALLELSDAALRDKKKLIVSTGGVIARTFATRSFGASIGEIFRRRLRGSSRNLYRCRSRRESRRREDLPLRGSCE
jgi:hypothetical protein